MYWLWFFIYGLIFGLLTSLAVKEKNRDQFGWFLIGFFFGVFGLVAALIISKNKDSKNTSAIFNTNNYEKKCPDCAEMIKLEAKVCRFCGRKFSEEEVQNLIDKEKNKYLANKDDSVTKNDINILSTIDKSKLKEDLKTIKRITVDRIDEKTGKILFTYEWRKGIKYSLISPMEGNISKRVLIYAGGNFFYCNKDDLG